MKLLYPLIILFSFLSASKWVSTEHFDELTLEKWMTLSLVSDEAQYLRNNYVNAQLIIISEDNHNGGFWNVFRIDWNGHLGGIDWYPISYRIDTNDIVEENWGRNGNSVTQYSGNGRNISLQLMGSKKVTFRVNPYEHKSVTHTFSLEGLDSLLNVHKEYFPELADSVFIENKLMELELERDLSDRKKQVEEDKMNYIITRDRIMVLMIFLGLSYWTWG